MTAREFNLTIVASLVAVIIVCATATAQVNHKTASGDTACRISTRQLKANYIPDSVFQMSGLRELIVSGEDCDFVRLDRQGNDISQCWMIREIPKEIKNLTRLTTLRLPQNAVRSIPEELGTLQKLRTLDLTDNSALTDIDNLPKLRSLHYLMLYGCGLSSLPKDIGNLKQLKELGLTGNNLSKAEQARIRKVLPACIIHF